MTAADVDNGCDLAKKLMWFVSTRSFVKPNAAITVTIVAVTKGFGVDAAEAAVEVGLLDVGENQAQQLVAKAEAGASFAITQLFFTADDYFALVARVRALGCQLPITPGIMPITNLRQVTRFAELSGAPLPRSVTDRVNEVADDDDQVRRVGIKIGTELSEELLSRGAPGLHFFTQNRSRATREIYANLHQVRRRA